MAIQPMTRAVPQVAGCDRLAFVVAMEFKGVGGWVVANSGSPLELTSSSRCNVPIVLVKRLGGGVSFKRSLIADS